MEAFIVDEGHIGNGIEICSGNRGLLGDIFDITNNMSYQPTQIEEKPGHRSKNNFYRFRINKNGCCLFLTDLNELARAYPNCKLAHKYERLNAITNYNGIKTANGLTKNKIITLLETPKTTNELQFALKLSNSTIIEHLTKMENNDIILRKAKIGNCVQWALIDKNILRA